MIRRYKARIPTRCFSELRHLVRRRVPRSFHPHSRRGGAQATGWLPWSAALVVSGRGGCSVVPTLRPARGHVAASLPRHGGVKPSLRAGRLQGRQKCSGGFIPPFGGARPPPPPPATNAIRHLRPSWCLGDFVVSLGFPWCLVTDLPTCLLASNNGSSDLGPRTVLLATRH
jgi:hypothetical protein